MGCFITYNIIIYYIKYIIINLYTDEDISDGVLYDILFYYIIVYLL